MNRRHFISTAAATTGFAALSRSFGAPAGTASAPAYLKGYETAYAQDPRAAATQWFREAKFGLILHYGLYSLEGRHEWLQFKEKIPVATYAKLKDRWGGNARPAYPSADPAYAYGKEHDLNKYVDFMTAQVTKLLTNYGPVAAICLDGIATPLHDKKAGGKPMEICSTLQNKGWGFVKNSAHLKPAKARMKLAAARKGGA
jgi:hypothetical protein